MSNFYCDTVVDYSPPTERLDLKKVDAWNLKFTQGGNIQSNDERLNLARFSSSVLYALFSKHMRVNRSEFTSRVIMRIFRILVQASTYLPIIFVALRYSQKFVQACQHDRSFFFTPNHILQLFMTSIVLATHFFDDFALSNFTWSRILHVPVKALNCHQRSYLSVIKYRLHISVSEYSAWIGTLTNFTATNFVHRMLPPPSPQPINPVFTFPWEKRAIRCSPITSIHEQCQFPLASVRSTRSVRFHPYLAKDIFSFIT